MAFKVVTTKATARMADLVEGILLKPSFRGVEWTDRALLDELTRIGVRLDAADLAIIGAELVLRGVIDGFP